MKAAGGDTEGGGTRRPWLARLWPATPGTTPQVRRGRPAVAGPGASCVAGRAMRGEPLEMGGSPTACAASLASRPLRAHAPGGARRRGERPDARSDRLLAIAGIALRFDAQAPEGSLPCIALGDSFEVACASPRSPRQGQHPDPRYRRRRSARARSGGGARGLRTLVGDAPLVAFHLAFDETLIQRHAGRAGRRPRTAGFDLAPVAATVAPDAKARARRLAGPLRHPPARCATRPRRTRWPRRSCCCACGRRSASSAGAESFELAALASQGAWLQR